MAQSVTFNRWKEVELEQVVGAAHREDAALRVEDDAIAGAPAFALEGRSLLC